MILQALFAAATLLVFIGVTPIQQEGEKKTPSKIGAWTTVEFHFRGKKQPQEACDERSFAFTEKEFHIIDRRWGIDFVSKYRFTRDESKSPIEFDFSDANGIVNRGIYKFEGDRLFVAYRESGDGMRPKDFTPMPQDMNSIYALVRKK